MERCKEKPFSEQQLNDLSKDALVALVLSINEQNIALQKQLKDITEQLAILTQQRFGRRTEKDLPIPGQLNLNDFGVAVLNEAEAALDAGEVEEPAIEEVVVRRHKRPKGKRQIDLASLEHEAVPHYLPEEELRKIFPGGWHQLEDETYSELVYHPARFTVLEHHIGVYAGDHAGDTIVRGNVPGRLLDHSIVTPELAPMIFNAKYVNALPINRLSEEFSYNDIHISKQVMAGWMIRITGYYLGPVRQKFKEKLLSSLVIHCDETPFKMTGKKEEGDPKSKDYMWVYHAPEIEGSPPVFLYDYDNGSRAAYVPREFLKDYKGILVTDGYQSYHTLANERPDDLQVAGCFAHARRKFAEIVKVAPKGSVLTAGQKLAAEGVQRIAVIYHTDNMKKGAKPEERLAHRTQSVKPLVDAYFQWVKESAASEELDSSSKLREALNYSINQEKYLRVFLEDPYVPLDNNDAERSIKKFCVGKHSWHIIASKKGAKASALLYSIAETAKANGLKPYNYFCHLLSQLKEYPRGNVPQDVLEKLMPWSPDLPDECRKKTAS